MPGEIFLRSDKVSHLVGNIASFMGFIVTSDRQECGSGLNDLPEQWDSLDRGHFRLANNCVVFFLFVPLEVKRKENDGTHAS